MNTQEYFDHVLKLKQEMTMNEFCYLPDTQLLKPFLSEIWALEYEEEPNYNKLKLMLVKILLGKGVVPNPVIEGSNQNDFDEIEELKVFDEMQNGVSNEPEEEKSQNIEATGNIFNQLYSVFKKFDPQD